MATNRSRSIFNIRDLVNVTERSLLLKWGSANTNYQLNYTSRAGTHACTH